MLVTKPDVQSDLVAFAKFLRGVPRLVRLRMAADRARETVQQRLQPRTQNFLASVERGVFANTCSPYRKVMASDFRSALRFHATIGVAMVGSPDGLGSMQ